MRRFVNQDCWDRLKNVRYVIDCFLSFFSHLDTESTQNLDMTTLLDISLLSKFIQHQILNRLVYYIKGFEEEEKNFTRETKCPIICTTSQKYRWVSPSITIRNDYNQNNILPVSAET